MEGEGTDRNHHRQRTEVAIWLEIARRPALDAGAVEGHGVANQGRGNVGGGTVCRQYGDRIGDAQRKAAAAASAGSNTAHRRRSLDARRRDDGGPLQIGDEPSGEALARCQVEQREVE